LKAALLKIDSYSLAHLLQLPSGAIIDAIHERFDCPGQYEIRVYGAGWETAPGSVIVSTKATITSANALRYTPQTIDWGFPE